MAVILALTWLATAVVVTLNVADVAPAETVTELGTDVDASLLESAIVVPPEGAAPFSATVPAEPEPPVTDVGERLRDETLRVSIRSSSPRVLLPRVPVIQAVVDFPTAVVPTEKVAEVAPDATVTLEATVAAALLLANETTTPSVPAAALRVAVPVADAPPSTTCGDKLTASSLGPAA